MFMQKNTEFKELTEKELYVLNCFWQAKEPLKVSMISSYLGEKGVCTRDTVRRIINELCGNNIICVADVKKDGKQYVRYYAPTLTKAEYFSQLLVKYHVSMDIIPEFIALKKNIKAEPGQVQLQTVVHELEKITALLIKRI
jgi:predicted transcriptional regulator